MQIKALQADVAVEELEEMVKKRYDKNEIELLKKELEIYKQSETNGGDIAQKLNAANEQIYQLRNAIDLKDNEIIKFKRKINDMQNSLDVKEKEVSALRSEVDSLREEIDNQRQIEEQIIERQEPIEKMREKNKQIQSLLDELRDIETLNLELANQVKKLKLELNSATNEIQLSCNQMEIFRQQIKELNQLNDDFVKERAFLQNEIKVLRDIIEKYENEDDSIADKFSEKVEQLRQLIRLKDEEIMRLKSMSIFPNKNLRNGQNLNIEIEERDKQIELLKSQLNEAVIDMESQTEIIQKLMLQNRSEEHVLGLNQQIVALNNKLKCIEEEVQTKDEELLALRKRINLYERGEYGLKDALKEVNDLQKHLNNRDQRIEEMIQQINELQLKLNDAMDQIDLLSEGNHHLNSTTNKAKNDRTKNFSRKEKIKFLEMQQQLIKLEEEKIALSEQLRLNFGKSTADKDYEISGIHQEINKLKNQLKTVETENFELQLGMKEILNGIRESDSMSDVVIECPSLERVCQLLESRSLSRDLSNIIVLKAELDLVRGHNEQLRTEMRKIRNDYLKVISQYTQDLLERETFVIQNNNKEKNFRDNDTEDSNAFNRQFDPEVDEESNVAENDFEIKESSDESEEDRTEPKQEDSVSLNECIEITFVNQESQTLPMNLVSDQIDFKSDSNTDNYTQTDKNFAEISAKEENQSDLSAKKLCANCTKVLKIVDFLKNCVEKLEENIRSSEAKYAQHLNLLQQENKVS
jgi:centrosomal protein CEP290